MVNKTVFSRKVAKSDVINKAGGRAYSLTAKHELAQLAATGFIGNTYYQKAQDELNRIVDLASQVSDEYLAKVAVYSRQKAYMKDMPAVLVAILSTRNPELTHKVFPVCIDNGRVLRTFFTIIRSGVLGRRGFGSALKRDMQNWFNDASINKLMAASIGNDPSLRDVMRMVRPKPTNNERRAMFGYLTGSPEEKWQPADWTDLPNSVLMLERFRRDTRAADQIEAMQYIPFRWDMLADSVCDDSVWVEIAKNMGHQALRMNLNTLARHGVFNDNEMVDYVAGRLSDQEEVANARQFPYQYFAAYMNAGDDVPRAIKSALHKSAEIACGNVPKLDKPVIIAVDTSASMSQGMANNRGHSSVMRVQDVAALFGAAMLRANPDSVLMQFDTSASVMDFDPEDTILSMTKRLANHCGGGTDCGAAIAAANRIRNRDFGGIVMISDNASWYNGNTYHRWSGYTSVVDEWNTFKKSNNRAKLVCIDVNTNGTAQAPEDRNILNVGGFSDNVFKIVAGFMSDDSSRFVKQVETITL